MKNFFNVLSNQNMNEQIMNAQNVRTDIMGELEAIILYQSHISATDNFAVRKTLTDIMDEEKVHVGQLFGLLFTLDPDSKTLFEKGYNEFMNEDNR